jgi:hypothetical protein
MVNRVSGAAISVLISGHILMFAGGCASVPPVQQEVRSAIQAVPEQEAAPARAGDNRIAPGRVMQGSISTPQQVNRYEIDLEEGQELVVFGRALGESTGTLRLSVQDAVGRLMGPNGTNPLSMRVAADIRERAYPRVRIERSGTYIIEIKGMSDRHTGRYEILPVVTP